MIRKDWVSHEMFQDGTEDGTEVGTTLMAVRVITTHTLDRWRRKALKMAKTGYAIQWGDLAQDILRVLEPKKGAIYTRTHFATHNHILDLIEELMK